MDKDQVKKGLRVVIVACESAEGDESQNFVGMHGTVDDYCQTCPDVLLDNGRVVVCDHAEIEPLAQEETKVAVPGAGALAEALVARRALAAAQKRYDEAEADLLAFVRNQINGGE